MNKAKAGAALASAGPLVWASLAALLSNSLLSIKWWHPHCDNPADGTGHFAWGFPFPYAEPTGASSLEFSYMPQVLALNLLILGLFAFLAIRGIFALGTSFTLKSAASALGLILTLIGASLNVMYLGTLGHATFTIGSNDDVYWSYRPMAIMRIGEHKECYF